MEQTGHADHGRRERGRGAGSRIACPRSSRSTRSRPPRRWASSPTRCSAAGTPNLWGAVPQVIEMQSEAGAAGRAPRGAAGRRPVHDVHGVPGPPADDPEHVQDRRRAHAGGDPRRGAYARDPRAVDLRRPQRRHGRPADRAGRCSRSSDVQAAQDLAAVAHAATLESRVPFLHFFDGFRTSHEVNVIAPLGDDVLRALIDDHLVRAHRERALSPDHPALRGTAQNPDVFFQAREASQPVPRDRAAGRAVDDGPVRPSSPGAAYHLFDYHGAPDAERVVVLMGSGNGAVTRDGRRARGARARRSASSTSGCSGRSTRAAFVATLPPTVRAIAVLDRTKEPGAARRAAVPGRRDRARRAVASATDGPAAGDRRAVRARVQGVRPADGQGRVRRAREGHSRRTTSPSASSTTSRTRRSTSTGRSRPSDDDVVRPSSTGSGADGTVSANKSSVKIIGERHRPVRAGLLRLRLEEVRFDDDVAPAVRAAADPLDLPDRLRARELRRVPPVRVPRAHRRARRSRRRARRSC